MHLLILTGFLGSGKTTLLLRLANLARSSGKKVAILVNEVGEIGINNQLMQQLGFNVWELLGGCICCSLAGDVTGTLDRVREDYQPDLILLEPSGAADPRNLLSILESYKNSSFLSWKKVALIDPLRMDMLMAVVSPLIIATMQQADVILINKADAASAEELENTHKIAIEHRPQGRIFTICARDEIGTDLAGELLPWKISN